MTYVYVFAGRRQPLKVGASRNPESRVKSFTRSGEMSLRVVLKKQCPDHFAVESRAHKLLKPYCVGGEWFNVPQRIAMKTVRQAALEIARERTSPDWPKWHWASSPEAQKAYQLALNREAGRAAARARKKELKA